MHILSIIIFSKLSVRVCIVWILTVYVLMSGCKDHDDVESNASIYSARLIHIWWTEPHEVVIWGIMLLCLEVIAKR